MVIEKFRSRYAEYWVQNNILYTRIINPLTINLAVAKQLVEDRRSFTKGTPFISLLDIEKVKASTREARKFMASEKASKELLAVALVTDETVSNVIGQIYIARHNPVIPTQVFQYEEKALQWLDQFKLTYTK